VPGAKCRRDQREHIGELRVERPPAALRRDLQRDERHRETGEHEQQGQEGACADDDPGHTGDERTCKGEVGQVAEPQLQA